MFIIKWMEYIPKEIDVVFIGSNLQEEEISILKKHFNNPMFFFTQSDVTDQSILDMLLRCNITNFGYIDIDAMTLNPKILLELQNITNEIAINCYRKYNIFRDIGVCETNLMYFNTTVCKTVNIQPYSYSYHSRNYPIPNEYFPEIADSIPLGLYPFSNYFDTLILFQIVCLALQKKIICIQKNQLPEEKDIDFIHIGQCGFISRLYSNQLGKKKYIPSLHNIKTLILTKRLIEKYKNMLPQDYLKFYEDINNIIDESHFSDIIPMIAKDLTIRRIPKQILHKIMN